MSGKFAAYRTPSPRSAGLKILVSAVQSRPSPPFISNSSPPRNFSCSEFVTKFVTNSGTLQPIPAHEPVFGETPRVERRSLRSSIRWARNRRAVSLFFAAHHGDRTIAGRGHRDGTAGPKPIAEHSASLPLGMEGLPRQTGRGLWATGQCRGSCLSVFTRRAFRY